MVVFMHDVPSLQAPAHAAPPRALGDFHIVARPYPARIVVGSCSGRKSTGGPPPGGTGGGPDPRGTSVRHLTVDDPERSWCPPGLRARAPARWPSRAVDGHRHADPERGPHAVHRGDGHPDAAVARRVGRHGGHAVHGVTTTEVVRAVQRSEWPGLPA